jgi:hypothetical protein
VIRASKALQHLARFDLGGGGQPTPPNTQAEGVARAAEGERRLISMH